MHGEALEELKGQGYTILRGLVPAERLERLRAALEEWTTQCAAGLPFSTAGLPVWSAAV